ncbi:MAG: hypothetical protein PHV25_02185 [Candidatus Pacebacteria bacterium]|nr:hypothetical protein [Candidatus Paceibacterota bacterium]
MKSVYFLFQAPNCTGKDLEKWEEGELPHCCSKQLKAIEGSGQETCSLGCHEIEWDIRDLNLWIVVKSS